MKENLEVYDLLKSVPKEYLKTIQAGRLKGMSDIKPQWRIQRMTEVFGMCGFGWKISNVQFEYHKGSAEQIVCACRLELFVKQNGEWSDAIIGVGGNTFIANEKNGLYTSDEAEKMAYTDAISVATKMIGLASDVYMGHGGKYDAPKVEQEKPKLVEGSIMWNLAVGKLKAGTTTIDKINESYPLSEEEKTKLLDQSKL